MQHTGQTHTHPHTQSCSCIVPHSHSCVVMMIMLQEEGEKFRLLSLLLAPVTRLHTYLSTVQVCNSRTHAHIKTEIHSDTHTSMFVCVYQVLLSCLSGEHSDWHSLHSSNQVLRNLYTRCHMTLERAGRWTDGARQPNEGVDSANGSVCFLY